MTSRYIGSGRAREGGFGATHKQDFNAHTSGGDFRHTADQVDLLRSISGITGTNVQTVLEQLKASIASAGTGFISIGDGYNTFGTYNVSADGYTTTFEKALSLAFADKRLQHGGVILIMAGTYTMTSTVTIPAGISLMGEIAGTLIIGNMSEQSMFNISYISLSRNIGGNSGLGSVSLDVGSNSEKVRFYNLMLADHLSLTNSTMTTVPMISVQKGANFECDRVTFLGKLNDGTITNRLKTQSCIGTIAGSTTGTYIKLSECFIDGVKSGIILNSASGDQDTLIISNTKARWYGKEGVSYDILNDAFIKASLCNALISNSYLVGAGSFANTVLSLQPTSGTTNVKINIIGLNGGPNTNPGNLIDNNSGVTSIQANTSGNNWGNNIDNPWFLVVGGSNGNTPTGDIFGPGAIDTVLTYTSFKGTVIVNPGTYTVTGTASSSTNWTKLKFIGNKYGNQYPIFNMAVSASGTDSLGNKFLVLGNHLEGIYFNGNGAVNSIHPTFSATGINTQTFSNTLTVKDCIFNDIALVIQSMSGTSTDELGYTSESIIKIQDCYFNQTGTYNETVSFMCPASDLIDLNNCYFKGKGYYIYVGYGGGEPTLARGILNMDRVICDATGTTITHVHPIGGAASGHVFISTNNINNINIRNSEFLASNTLACVNTLIGGGITTYSEFLYLSSANINITNSTFNGPNQTFTSAGTDYPIMTVRCIPTISCKITNSHFCGGGLPLYVGGSLNNNTLKENIIIDNNNFNGGSTITNSNTQTLLDIDLNCTSTSTTSLLVKNNTFRSSNGSAPVYPLHSNVTGATYDTNGIVQIYCRGVNAIVTGNHIRGQLNAPTSNPFTHFTGLHVNTFNSPSGATTLLTTATITDNNISIINNFNTASATNSASCVRVYTTTGMITNNMLNMRNVTVNVSITCCLHILNTKINNTGNITICHNNFGRSADDGTQFSLVGGYIYFASGCSGGAIITDNAFDSTTIDGSSTALQFSVVSTYTRIFNRNKNQTVTVYLRGNNGLFGVYDPTGPGNFNVFNGYGVLASGTDSYINLNPKSATNSNIQFTYGSVDAGIETGFVWTLPLHEIMPIGTYFISASVFLAINSNVSGGGSKSIANLNSLISGTETVEATANPLTTTGATLTFTAPTATYISTDPQFGNAIQLRWDVNNATARYVLVGPMTITYRW